MPLLKEMFRQFEHVFADHYELTDPTSYTHDFLLFCEKLKALDGEFDEAVAARIAKVLLEQYDIRRQKLQLYEETKNDGGQGISHQLRLELEHREHEVQLEDVMKFDDEQLKYRVGEIARHACQMLKEMEVPCKFFLRDVGNDPDVLEPKQVNGQAMKMLVTKIMPKQFQRVVVAGIPFILDHFKKQAEHAQPQLPPNRQNSLK